MTQAAEVIPFPSNPQKVAEGRGGLGGKEIVSPPVQNLSEVRGERPRNVAWDALVEVLGFEPLTATEKSLWGKIAYSLNCAGATAETINMVATEYHKEWPDCTLTITALEKWYSQFLAKGQEKRRKKVVCRGCGIGGGHHLSDCPDI